ncbi:MAG: AraC family transcriptional regulator [Treponema sp.]|nr:AraC family transcriptional regulator [Treponema sp.]
MLEATDQTYKGITVAEVCLELLEAVLRLVNLLDTPERICHRLHFAIISAGSRV